MILFQTSSFPKINGKFEVTVNWDSGKLVYFVTDESWKEKLTNFFIEMTPRGMGRRQHEDFCHRTRR